MARVYIIVPQRRPHPAAGWLSEWGETPGWYPGAPGRWRAHVLPDMLTQA